MRFFSLFKPLPFIYGYNEYYHIILGDKVDQFGLFREALHSDEIEIRVNALKKLNNVAEAIGLERTKNELLPLLKGIALINFIVFYRRVFR